MLKKHVGPFHNLTLCCYLWFGLSRNPLLLYWVTFQITASEWSILFLKILCGFQMLQCIIGMVDKTKRAVSVLQQRCGQDRDELLAWARKTAEETEAEVKRRAGMCSVTRSPGSARHSTCLVNNHWHHNVYSLTFHFVEPIKDFFPL